MSDVLSEAEMESFVDQAIGLTYSEKFQAARAKMTRKKAIRVFLQQCLAALENGVIEDDIDVGMACSLLGELSEAYSTTGDDQGFRDGLTGKWQPSELFLDALHVPHDPAALHQLHPGDASQDPGQAACVAQKCVMRSHEGSQVSHAYRRDGRVLRRRIRRRSTDQSRKFPVTEIEPDESEAGKFHVVIVDPNGKQSFNATDPGEPDSLPGALELIKLIDEPVQYILLPAKADKGMVPCDESAAESRARHACRPRRGIRRRSSSHT